MRMNVSCATNGNGGNMNERIKEFAKQALKHPDTDNDGLTVFDNDELEKFTELIVQECLKLCKEVEDEMTDIYTGDELDATQVGARYCYEAILSEFGVEE